MQTQEQIANTSPHSSEQKGTKVPSPEASREVKESKYDGSSHDSAFNRFGLSERAVDSREVAKKREEFAVSLRNQKRKELLETKRKS